MTTRPRAAMLVLLLAAPAWPAPALAARGGSAVVLARVDGEAVTLEELRAEFERRHQGHLPLAGDEATVRDFLAACVRRRLFTHEARRMHLDADPDVRRRAEAERDRLAVEWLFETEVEARVRVTDEDIARALEQAEVGLEVVLIRTDLRDEALAASERVRGGESAEQVAREVSTARSRLHGGLSLLRWGEVEPALEAAAWATAEGQSSTPVAVEEGWAFVHVVARREVDVQEGHASTVRERLERRALDAVRDAWLDRLRERRRAEVHPELLDPALLAPLVDDPSGLAEDARAIAGFDGGEVTLADFVRSIKRESFLALRPGQQALQAGHLLSDLVDRRLVEIEGRERWERAPESFKARARDFEDDLIFRKLLATVVFEGLAVGDDEIHERYEARQESYADPPAIHLAIALLDTAEEAEALLAEARAGRPFDELARARSKDPETATRGGTAGWVTREQAIPELRDLPFDGEAGALGGPLRVERGWLVWRVLDRRAARTPAEDEVRDRVRSEIMEQKSRERLEAWEGRLRAAASIKVYDRAVREAGRILAAEESARAAERRGAAGGGG